MSLRCVARARFALVPPVASSTEDISKLEEQALSPEQQAKEVKSLSIRVAVWLGCTAVLSARVSPEIGLAPAFMAVRDFDKLLEIYFTPHGN
ncbi:hypothetical protein GPECTOR_323g34 [Gonium pectorale]|uniref:Uncharacterized protein n=1 Tax=Gonium pectorale TaxID=33097 RepID=A0A150FVT6_GONPE|nr:hypothetical protein GPECTOR_323g34 [Gonium pectorale]|eukprot:KXZ41678.1 hypothetical protein GPECTOR_323g34 [Gonium pectorale]